MKKISLLLAILIGSSCILGAQAPRPQSDAMRKAVEERRKKAEAAKKNAAAPATPEANSTEPDAGGANPGAGNEKGEIDFTSGKMYTQLISFRYDPSERDPFISAEVTSPFVTSTDPEKEYGLPPDDTARIAAAIKKIEDALRDYLSNGLAGVSSAKIGLGYSMLKGGMIIRAGDTIAVTVGQDVVMKINDARQESAASGKNLDIAFSGNGELMLEVQKVDGYDVYFYTPGDKTRTFSTSYKKQIEGGIEKQQEKFKPLPPPM